ncbi:MAG: HlyD family efflux transporter periplasmic adaptor subunit [Chitinophagaceae bacterium]|nr:HlyD family efflux transporter periplasmic adaptor subunit [Chitinophagaceae bacterium]
MKSTVKLFAAGLLVILAACNNKNGKFDASGTFEADEVIVSSELPGKIVRFDVEEGRTFPKDTIVGTLDAESISLQKEQVRANIESLGEKTADVTPQVKLLEDQLTVQQSRLSTLLHEKGRIENLLRQDAATGKQLDDVNAEIDIARKNMTVTRQQIQVQRNNVATQNRGILSEGKPLEKRVAQLDDQLKRANIINPVNGTVIIKYAEAGEITSAGKALYKIADLSTMTLRAYITGTQLSQVKLGQAVKVFVDDGADKYKELPGTITWVSDKAEFTPKTIQTKDERANLVYAIKVKVKNDGYLKIGMYGEVKFQ